MTEIATEQQTKPAMKTYVVMADAVMLTTGKKPNGTPIVSRVMHGTEINALPTDERIVDLLAIKAVVLKGHKAAERGARVSVKQVAKGMLPEGEDLDLMNGMDLLPADNPEAVRAVGEIPLVSVVPGV